MDVIYGMIKCGSETFL